MRVVVTGTPGTGKTTATDLLDTDLDVVHLNDVIREEDGLYSEVDEERDSLVADLDAVREWLGDRDDVLVDSHLAHHLDADKVVVLRCRPDLLEQRLRDRGEPNAKARENAESEALDVILSEAVSAHGLDAVYEIDTTDRRPEAVAADIEAVIAGDREPSAGAVSFIDYL
ncbi:adenylate kinase family protein [Haladaptatus sp. GCM10025707]|uniref:adenylate kinase family protein n=1 Tax=unclassified Haladaptatus TaxID=2622732 RepID=UPI0023E82CDF|nr:MULTISPECIES: adenylate kinase family protein [unclassified Haladaptatus]